MLRFNFRGVGASAGTFDQGRGEREDFRAALDFLADRYPGVPLWAAGFSFGAWIALEAGAADPRVSVLIGIAPPVCRPNYSFEEVLASRSRSSSSMEGSTKSVPSRTCGPSTRS